MPARKYNKDRKIGSENNYPDDNEEVQATFQNRGGMGAATSGAPSEVVPATNAVAHDVVTVKNVRWPSDSGNDTNIIRQVLEDYSVLQGGDVRMEISEMIGYA